MAAARKTQKKSFRLDPELVAEARRITGAKDETEAVRIALEELLERVHRGRQPRAARGRRTAARSV